MEEKLLDENDMELYGFRLQTDPLWSDEEKLERLIVLGDGALREGKFVKAREYFSRAKLLSPADARVAVGCMRAYSEDFQNLTNVKELSALYFDAERQAGAPFTAAIRKQFGSVLRERLRAVEEEERAAKAAWEQKQTKNIAVAREKCTRGAVATAVCSGLCVAFTVAAICCGVIAGSVPFAATFGVLAAAGGAAALFFAVGWAKALKAKGESERPAFDPTGKTWLRLKKTKAFLECVTGEREQGGLKTVETNMRKTENVESNLL